VIPDATSFATGQSYTQRGCIGSFGKENDPLRNGMIEHPKQSKRSIGIDVSTAQGLQRIFDIGREADVFLNNYRPSTMPAAVDLRKMEYQLDVRLNQQAYERHDLPVEVQQKLLLLMRRIGLEYGAIDLRLRPDGQYVFFEVNPAGQFLFVEHACKLPISDVLARHLARGKESRVQAIAPLKAA
jgi:hypothetical protein